MKVGISGFGFVGRAVTKAFCERLMGENVEVYDPYFNSMPSSDEASVVNWFKTTFKVERPLFTDFSKLLTCDVVFLCVPTLNVKSKAEGKVYEQDTGPLKDNLDKFQEAGYDGVIAVKSTVLPSNLDKFVHDYPDLRIVGNPEFLQQNNAYLDFINARVTIIGGKLEDAQEVALAYLEAGMTAPIKFLQTAADAMLAKYLVNNFFVVKNAFFNEMRLLTLRAGLDFEGALVAAMEDDRIHPVHTQVPGPDGQLGFGGACLPKDAIAMYSDTVSKMLDAALTVNEGVRGDGNSLI